ncbi:MAG: N-acetylmuramoyl-L-alanine amidase [Candidatus Eremiobacteraeota bacterium]|nr:N-acetylmuramoyl-L-alanine amidase [Candidatus Eremiobacteraeota bacterium]
MLVPADPARADSSLVAVYAQQTIRFTHISEQNGALAVGTEDPGLQALLRATGAVMTWKPGERYVMLTTAVPVVVSFSVGDRRYDVGPLALQASFAPYQQGEEVYLPFEEVLRCLDLALRPDGPLEFLQPQLASLDLQNQGGRITIVAHGGAPLHPRVVNQNPSDVVYEFDGVGTTLAGTRAVNEGGVRSYTITQRGTVRDPKTLVTFDLSPGATPGAIHTNDDRDVVLSFSGSPPGLAAVSPPNAAEAQSAPAAVATAPPGASAPALVTGVTVTQTTGGYLLAIAVAGNASFEWHRLRDPDDRFWVDIQGAQLQGPPIEQEEPDPLVSLRVRQMDAQTVRVALSLLGPKTLDILPSANGLGIQVGRGDAASALARQGAGSIGATVSSSEQQEAPVTPAPGDETAGGDESGWKFGPREPSYSPTNPRLIVIDPGHGGSDRGAMHGGFSEADLNLDMAKRLRAVLVSRGWQVQMTRDTDVDVYQPDDTPHEELQARVDVANNAGARLFISIHANAFINSGPYGTTYYVSKKSDVALAESIEQHLQSDGTKNDGIIKSHLYVTLHTRMPAVLIETAFLTNPNDLALLASSAWRERIMHEIADGIDEYAQTYPIANQPAL